MTCTENKFLITVDVSKIQNKTEAVNYTMLIDDTKMTIVYEVIEWIRWAFSVDDCIYLTHDNNSGIHELEDVRILSMLKTLQVNYCGVDCIHEKIYQRVLSKINFFMMWNQVKVPRIFVEKLSLIDKKLQTKNEGSKEICLNIRGNTSGVVQQNSFPKPSCNKSDDKVQQAHKPLFSADWEVPADSPFLFKPEDWKVKEDKGAELPSDHSTIGKHSQHGNSQKLSNLNNFNVKSEQVHNSDNFNSPISTCSSIPKQPEPFTKPENPSENVKNSNSTGDLTKQSGASGGNKTVSNTWKNRRHIKPFSLSDVLTNLRAATQACQNQVVYPVQPIVTLAHQPITTVTHTHQPVTTVTSITRVDSFSRGECQGPEDNSGEEPKKKRRRTRRSRSKRRNDMPSTNFQPEADTLSNQSVGVKQYDKQPSHIRFNSQSSGEETETNTPDQLGQISGNTCGNSAQEAITGDNNSGTNGPSRVDDGRTNFPSAVSSEIESSCPQGSTNKSESERTGDHFDKMLEDLKKKYPLPVVCHRY